MLHSPLLTCLLQKKKKFKKPKNFSAASDFLFIPYLKEVSGQLPEATEKLLGV